MATVTNANGIIAQAAQAQVEASKPKKPSVIMQELLDNEHTKKILQMLCTRTQTAIQRAYWICSSVIRRYSSVDLNLY